MANPTPKPAPSPAIAETDPLKAPPPPGADPRGKWHYKPNDGTYVWRVEGIDPVTNPPDAVLVERGRKVQAELRQQVFPTPHDVLDETEVDWKIKNGWEWYDAPNGKRVLRKRNAQPDLRPRMSDAEIMEAAKTGKIKFPTPDEVRANVALQESLRRDDGRQRIAPEAAGLLQIPKL